MSCLEGMDTKEDVSPSDVPASEPLSDAEWFDDEAMDADDGTPAWPSQGECLPSALQLSGMLISSPFRRITPVFHRTSRTDATLFSTRMLESEGTSLSTPTNGRFSGRGIALSAHESRYRSRQGATAPAWGLSASSPPTTLTSPLA